MSAWISCSAPVMMWSGYGAGDQCRRTDMEHACFEGKSASGSWGQTVLVLWWNPVMSMIHADPSRGGLWKPWSPHWRCVAEEWDFWETYWQVWHLSCWKGPAGSIRLQDHFSPWRQSRWENKPEFIFLFISSGLSPPDFFSFNGYCHSVHRCFQSCSLSSSLVALIPQLICEPQKRVIEFNLTSQPICRWIKLHRNVLIYLYFF